MAFFVLTVLAGAIVRDLSSRNDVEEIGFKKIFSMGRRSPSQ
jgi:hypothetical protein